MLDVLVLCITTVEAQIELYISLRGANVPVQVIAFNRKQQVDRIVFQYKYAQIHDVFRNCRCIACRYDYLFPWQLSRFGFHMCNIYLAVR